MRKKRSFTLLEMLVVMFLLSITTAVVSYGLVTSSKEERFSAQSNLVLGQLRMATELMMLGTDLTVVLTKEQIALVPKIKGKHRSLALLDRVNKLEGIEEITFLDYDGTHTDLITLPFLSKGGKMPQGELVLTAGNREKRILFEGYPQFLNFKEKRKEREPLIASEEWYPYDPT